MSDFMQALKLIFAAFATGISYLFGGWSTALTALVIFLAADYLTGVLCAVSHRELSSETGTKGLIKKLMVLIILITAGLLDRVIGSEQWLCRTAVCYFYIANEGISILENITRLGVPVPKKIRAVLIQLKGRAEDEENA